MSERTTVSCRVDFRVLPAASFTEHTGRVESLWATGCTILAPHHPASDARLELRLYLPDGEWPLRVEDAHITVAYRDIHGGVHPPGPRSRASATVSCP